MKQRDTSAAISKQLEQAIADSANNGKIPVAITKDDRKEILVTMRFDDWLEFFNSFLGTKNVQNLSDKRRPLPLEVESSYFAEVWKRCTKDKTSDLTELMQIMDPAFDKWEDFLVKRDLDIDINYLTLCRILSPDPELALKKIASWVEWADTSSSVKEELQLIFRESAENALYSRHGWR